MFLIKFFYFYVINIEIFFPYSFKQKEERKDLYEGNVYLVRHKEELNVFVALTASFLIPR
jgi:hypothetical protein